MKPNPVASAAPPACHPGSVALPQRFNLSEKDTKGVVHPNCTRSGRGCWVLQPPEWVKDCRRSMKVRALKFLCTCRTLSRSSFLMTCMSYSLLPDVHSPNQSLPLSVDPIIPSPLQPVVINSNPVAPNPRSSLHYLRAQVQSLPLKPGLPSHHPTFCFGSSPR